MLDARNRGPLSLFVNSAAALATLVCCRIRKDLADMEGRKAKQDNCKHCTAKPEVADRQISGHKVLHPRS